MLAARLVWLIDRPSLPGQEDEALVMERFVRETAHIYDRFLRELVMKGFLCAVFELMVFIFIRHGLLIPMLI